MSNSRRPVVAYTIPVYDNPDGPRYCIYTDAYGLEMTIDDEWPVDTILMSAPELVDVITDETDVTSMGTVFAGASSAPENNDFQSIAKTKATHVLLGRGDDIDGALSAGLTVVLRVGAGDDVTSLLQHESATSETVILAVEASPLPSPDKAQSLVAPIREACNNAGCGDARILIVGEIDENNIADYLAMQDIDGTLLLDSSYDVVTEILTVIAEA